MPPLSISAVARRFGVNASAIRYYEELGILPHPERVGGKRRYDETVLARMAIVQRARQAGFSLTEIRTLFSGFRNGTPASERWRKLASRKAEEIAATIQQLQAMQELLARLQRCGCEELEHCGRCMLARADVNSNIKRQGPGRKQMPHPSQKA